MTDMQFKLVAFDIDGTIMDENNQVCKRLIDVVAKLQDNGVIFTLASARVPKSVLDIATQLGIKGHVISLNGSLITNDQHEILYSKSFETARVKNALAKIDKKISRNYYDQFDWIVEYENDYTQFEINLLASVTLPVDKVVPANVNKITLIGDHDILVEAKEQVAKDKSLLLGFSHHNYVEVTCSTISKFQGIKTYARSLGIRPEEVVAFGDGENDMPMLSSVGLGVAMGNAHQHIKDVAKDVAGNNYEQGVAIYLEELFNLR